MKDDCCEERTPPGLSSRVTMSIAVFFGWLIFLAVWLFFYASRFTVLENIGIALIAFLVGLAILAVVWASWGIKYGKQAERWEKRVERKNAKPQNQKKPARKRPRKRENN